MKITGRVQGMGGGRTLAGVTVFVFLSMAAMTVIGVFAHLAARQNASALLYERAVSQLEVVVRGLSEAALADGHGTSRDVFHSGWNGFQSLRRGNAELHADTKDAWTDLDRRIKVMLRDPHYGASSHDAMASLGRVTADLDKLAAVLDARADEKRDSAAAAEERIQIVNIAAGVLLILGTAAFLVIRDQTTRKVLDGVRASASQLRDITDAVPALIAYIDAGQRFQFHNKAYEQTLGLTREQIQGRTVREVFGDEVYETKRARIDEVLSGVAAHFEHRLKNALGEERDFAVHLFPRRHADRSDQPVIGYYSLLTDITEMKRIDRMKTEFVSTVSHELRTPLTSIRGSLGLLSGGISGALPDAAKKLVDIAKSNCERLIRLINDILDTEKIESGQMHLNLKVLDLRMLVKQTIAANEGFGAQHHVRLALRAAERAMFAEVDADRLVQVLTNLLSNAIKFSPPQSRVDVTLSRGAGRVRVEVRDYGPGIPEEFRPRIFQKFSQADSSDTRQKGGTGLGLNITKAIVERLGGTIGFTSEAGVGTSFFFELPEWRDRGISTRILPKSPMAASRGAVQPT